WHRGRLRGSRDGTQTCPQSASMGVPLMRASSTLAWASSPGSTFTMWATSGGPSSSSGSEGRVVMTGAVSVVVTDMAGTERNRGRSGQTHRVSWRDVDDEAWDSDLGADDDSVLGPRQWGW